MRAWMYACDSFLREGTRLVVTSRDVRKGPPTPIPPLLGGWMGFEKAGTRTLSPSKHKCTCECMRRTCKTACESERR